MGCVVVESDVGEDGGRAGTPTAPLLTLCAVRAAHALASNDGTQLCFSHLEIVLDVGKEFENDFRGSGEMANMLSYA